MKTFIFHFPTRINVVGSLQSDSKELFCNELPWLRILPFAYYKDFWIRSTDTIQDLKVVSFPYIFIVSRRNRILY